MDKTVSAEVVREVIKDWMGSNGYGYHKGRESVADLLSEIVMQARAWERRRIRDQEER